jgi:hypothetical protein
MDQLKPTFDLDTFEGVVGDLVARLDEESKARLRDTPRGELIVYHHGWGTGIRNGYRLWSNQALLVSCAEKAGYKDTSFIHPDDASMLIIEAVWEAVTAQG